MYRLSLVRGLVLHFADLAGWDGDRYTVTFSKKVYDRAASRWRAEGIADDDLGATLRLNQSEPDRWPVTWIDPGIKHFGQLANTCAHEALHAARPAMPHGSAFEGAVRRMLRGREP